MRIDGWAAAAVVVGAIAIAGCEGVSTSSYAVAAGFAAAAAAAQIAEANQPPSAPPQPGSPGGAPSAGAQGPSAGAQGPSPGAPSTLAMSGLSNAPVSSPSSSPASSSAPSPSGPPPQVQFGVVLPPGSLCRPQLAVFCFLGSQPACVVDPSGCEICSCVPSGRYDWSNPR